MGRKKAKQLAYELVTYLQIDQLDEQWRRALKSIQTSFLRAGTDDAANVGMAIIEGFWGFSIHWVYKKKWNPQHKIPHSTDAKKAEPFGNLLLSILNLCEALHTISPSGYSNAAEWFDCVAWEIKNRDLRDLFDLSGRKGTDDEIRRIRAQLADYRNGINPHVKKTEPHTWKLVDVALKVSASEAFPKIANEFWRGIRCKGKDLGYQHALTAWASTLESPDYQVIAVKNGKIFLCQGRKKDTPKWVEIRLPSDAEKSVLSNPLWARLCGFNLEKSTPKVGMVKRMKSQKILP